MKDQGNVTHIKFPIIFTILFVQYLSCILVHALNFSIFAFLYNGADV